MQINVSMMSVLFSLVTTGHRQQHGARRCLVSLHGRTYLSPHNAVAGVTNVSEIPPDPKSLLDKKEQEEMVHKLLDWWNDKKSVLCITGAGLSTESGIPDYRGHNGSYHKGHKPVIHQQFMESEYQRKRYWGRSMIGWKEFDQAKPNKGHFSLAQLEAIGKLGVTFEDHPTFYPPDGEDEFHFSSGQRKLTIITQNVDALHHRAGSKNIIQLHGAGNRLKCMGCGRKSDRNEYHTQLRDKNSAWLENAMSGSSDATELRPDGDALIKDAVDYNLIDIPACPKCGSDIIKTDVVFFGDSVPRDRVAKCQAAVKATDGILVVGTSLAVHSVFRHVRAASEMDIPIAILNVGETRAETESLDNITKINAPAGETLSACVEYFSNK